MTAPPNPSNDLFEVGDKEPDKVWTTGRIAVTLIIVSTILFWAWALGPLGPRDNPDTLDDVTYSPAAINICTAAQAQIDELEPAAEADDPEDRAATLVEANAIYGIMVNGLNTLVDPAGTEHDAVILEKWLGDWELYLGDRDDHVQRLLTEGDVAFQVTRVERTSVSSRLDWFARVNNMEECGLPGDL